MASFQAKFNQYFSEKLCPFGFKKLKGLPAFGRLMGGELLQYIILKNCSSLMKGKKAFTLVFGIYSIYSMTQGVPEKYELYHWGISLFRILPKKEHWNVYRDGEELQSLLYEFLYDGSNDEEIQSRLEEVFIYTRDKVIPFLDKVRNLSDYLMYCKQYKDYLLRWADTIPKNESLLLIYLNDHDDLLWLYERYCESVLNDCFQGNGDSEEYQKEQQMLYDIVIRQTAQARDKVYQQPDLYRKTMTELARRKELSVQVFRELGFGIP